MTRLKGFKQHAMMAIRRLHDPVLRTVKTLSQLVVAPGAARKEKAIKKKFKRK